MSQPFRVCVRLGGWVVLSDYLVAPFLTGSDSAATLLVLSRQKANLRKEKVNFSSTADPSYYFYDM